MKSSGDLSIKIVAGKYKGVKLELPSLKSTRSTKSIMKESLFNTLQFDIVGANFVEVFGGSGSIGLEALSRGAKHAFFIELDNKAFKILQSNCKKVSENDTSCLHGDSFCLFSNILDKLDSPAYFYIDPPFSIREGQEDIYDKTITLISSIPSEKKHLIIVEHMSNQKMPEVIGEYKMKKIKKFGKSTLTYYM